MKKIKSVLAVFIFLSVSSSAYAAIPQFIKYQGLLTDTTGAPIEGSQSMSFKLYDAASGGNLLWTESQSVIVSEGLFYVSLGSINSLSQEVFDEAQVWLGITIGANPELSPRERIAAVPYALQAEIAQMALATSGADWVFAGTLADLVSGSGALLSYPSAAYEYGLQWGNSILPAVCFTFWTGGYIFQTTQPMVVEVNAVSEFSYGGVYFMYGTTSADDDGATTSNWAHGLWTLDYFSPEANLAGRPFRTFGTSGTAVWARKR